MLGRIHQWSHLVLDFYIRFFFFIIDLIFLLVLGTYFFLGSFGYFCVSRSFPTCPDSKESAFNVGDLDSIPLFWRSPGGGHDNPLQYSCLENPHGGRSLGAADPGVAKSQDTTKRLSTVQLRNVCISPWLCNLFHIELFLVFSYESFYLYKVSSNVLVFISWF